MPLPKCRCVYAIVNKKNNKKYIGSTDNLRKRAWTHKSALKNGYHRNQKLQSDYNKLGESYFEFKILNRVSNKKDLLRQEEKQIKKTKKVYNKQKTPYLRIRSKKVMVTFYVTQEQMERLEKEENMSKTLREALDLYYSRRKNNETR